MRQRQAQTAGWPIRSRTPARGGSSVGGMFGSQGSRGSSAMKPSGADWAALQAAIAGDVILPGSPGYELVRKPAIARFHAVRPQAVVLCATSADVAETISLARRLRVPAAARSGGHCFAGRRLPGGRRRGAGWPDHGRRRTGMARDACTRTSPTRTSSTGPAPTTPATATGCSASRRATIQPASSASASRSGLSASRLGPAASGGGRGWHVPGAAR